MVARISGFHERWIASRFLGERIRAATFLGMVGQTEQRSVRTERILLEEPADAWIRRAFGEVWERRPQWHIADSDVGPLQRYLAEAWVGQQVSYHRMTARRYRRFAARRAPSAIAWGAASIR